MFRPISFLIIAILLVPFSTTAQMSVRERIQRTEARYGDFRADELEVFEYINAEREKRGRRPLEWNDRVAKVAREYSQKMAKESFFSHYDRWGKTVLDRAEGSHIRFRRIGENLFFCEPNDHFSEAAVRGWLRSTTHRQNMLDRGWTTSGIGIARARDGSIYVTQVFLQ